MGEVFTSLICFVRRKINDGEWRLKEGVRYL
jgi:hypothetical protein